MPGWMRWNFIGLPEGGLELAGHYRTVTAGLSTSTLTLSNRTMRGHLVGVFRVVRSSDHAVGGELGDGARAHAKEFAEHPLVVLAVARRAAIDDPGDGRRCLAQLERHLGDRPAADLRPGDLGQPAEVRQLGVTVTAVGRRLAHATGDAGRLE